MSIPKTISRRENFPHITLELDASNERNSTYHPTWLKEHSHLENPKDHFYIAASKQNYKLQDSSNLPKINLPEEIMNLTVENYLKNLQNNPNLIKGNHPWVHEKEYLNTYSIVTTPRSLPFKDDTISRLVAYDHLAPKIIRSNSINSRIEQNKVRLEIVNDMFDEFDRVLRPGGTIEFYEPRSEVQDSKLAFDHFVRVAESKLKGYNVKIFAKKLILIKKPE